MREATGFPEQNWVSPAGTSIFNRSGEIGCGRGNCYSDEILNSRRWPQTPGKISKLRTQFLGSPPILAFK